VLAQASQRARRSLPGPTRARTKLYDPELVANRRGIRSFFMQEVDRDKIVLAGEP
jgi:hypothetical protein